MTTVIQDQATNQNYTFSDVSLALWFVLGQHTPSDFRLVPLCSAGSNRRVQATARQRRRVIAGSRSR